MAQFEALGEKEDYNEVRRLLQLLPPFSPPLTAGAAGDRRSHEAAAVQRPHVRPHQTSL